MPDSLPPYTYIPGGPNPHPTRSPGGHSFGHGHEFVPPIQDGAWDQSVAFLRGVRLFNAGYYWEAHEAWEGLWHAHGRKGPVADVIKGLIKLAAAGVKVREGQPRGVATHAGRAAELFRSIGGALLGLDLDDLAARSDAIAEDPPTDPGGDAPVTVFGWVLEPGA